MNQILLNTFLNTNLEDIEGMMMQQDSQRFCNKIDSPLFHYRRRRNQRREKTSTTNFQDERNSRALCSSPIRGIRQLLFLSHFPLKVLLYLIFGVFVVVVVFSWSRLRFFFYLSSFFATSELKREQSVLLVLEKWAKKLFSRQKKSSKMAFWVPPGGGW